MKPDEQVMRGRGKKNGDSVVTPGLCFSEARYQLLFDLNPDGAFALNASGEFVLANRAWCALTGYAVNELLGRRFQELCAGAEVSNRSEASQPVLPFRGRGDVELVLVKKNGGKIDVWLSGEYLLLEDGTGLMYCTAKDITARKLPERLLVEAEQRQNLALEYGRMGTWDWYVPSAIAQWSAGHYLLLGYKVGEVPSVHDSFKSRVHPEDRRHQEMELEASMREKRDYHCEFRVVWPNGEIHWLEARGRYHYDANGNARRMYGVLIDIDARKAAEAALQESEERFRILAEGTPMMMWATDPQGEIAFINKAYCKFFRTSREAARKTGWRSLVHPDDVDAYVGRFLAAQEAREAFHGQCRVLRHDGVWRWVDSRAQPRYSASGEFTGMLGSSQDITERKAFQEELERQVRESTESLQITTKQLNDFCYSIAHDLKAPLRTQAAFASILLTECGEALGAKGREYANRILRAAERQGTLVTDLLAHMSVTRGELPTEALELKEVVQAALAELQDQIQEKRACVDAAGVAGRAIGNRESVRLSVMHLVSNALKFVPRGNTPQVFLRSETLPPYLRLSVLDNGIGIPEAYRHKLYGVFQRLHSTDDYPGTGIGLAVVKQAITRMGGRVGFESAVDKGSTFWIDLPAA